MLLRSTCHICFKEKKHTSFFTWCIACTNLAHLLHSMLNGTFVCVSKALCIYNYHKHMCRFESFNSKVRAYNVYGNRHSPSHDIAHHFSVLQQLRYICHGGMFDENGRYLLIYLNACIPIKALSSKVWQCIERLVLFQTYAPQYVWHSN